jgi:hypothetical protein
MRSYEPLMVSSFVRFVLSSTCGDEGDGAWHYEL